MLLINQNQKRKFLILAILLEKLIIILKLLNQKKKIPDISNLATKTAFSTVENTITDTSKLVRKTDCNTKITEIEKKITDNNHDKYITTPEFNTLATNFFNARIAQANLVTKTDFDNKLSDLNKKIVSNKTRDIAIEKQQKKNIQFWLFSQKELF